MINSQTFFSQHQGDIEHTKLIMIDIKMGDHLPIAQKTYALSIKHTQWVKEKLEMLEKSGIIYKVSPWSNPI